MGQRLAILALAGLVLASCSGQAQSGIDLDEATRAGEASVGSEEGGSSGADGAAAPPSDQKVIVTSSMHIHAADTRAAMDRVSSLVRGAGGFVAAAHVAPVTRDEEQPVIELTLRIPASSLDETLAAIRDEADEVVSERLSTEDVTEEYVDMEARLRNLRALEEELRALLAEVRGRPNADPDELLRVFQEISSVRGQIEQLEGRQRFLDNRVELATLGLTITPLPVTTPIVDEGWSPGLVARDALRSLVDTLQTVADGLIRFALVGLPVLLLIAFPLAVLWLLWRRFSVRRTPPPPAEEREPVEAGRH